MPACQCLSKPFVVSGESPKPTQPGEAPFHHPSARQQHKSPLRFAMLDHFQLDALVSRLFGHLCARVALIDVGDLDRAARDLLDLRFFWRRKPEHGNYDGMGHRWQQ